MKDDATSTCMSTLVTFIGMFYWQWLGQLIKEIMWQTFRDATGGHQAAGSGASHLVSIYASLAGLQKCSLPLNRQPVSTFLFGCWSSKECVLFKLYWLANYIWLNVLIWVFYIFRLHTKYLCPKHRLMSSNYAKCYTCNTWKAEIHFIRSEEHTSELQSR